MKASLQTHHNQTANSGYEPTAYERSVLMKVEALALDVAKRTAEQVAREQVRAILGKFSNSQFSPGTTPGGQS